MPRGTDDYRDTDAARMLSAGIRLMAADEKVSQRSLAKDLGYKQAVIMSHMALGRVPIPIDRAYQIAERLGLDVRVFMLAVLRQRYPSVPWQTFLDGEASADGDRLRNEIETIARCALDELSLEQKRVMREVAGDSAPGRRWLSLHEITEVEHFRENGRRNRALEDDGSDPPAMF